MTADLIGLVDVPLGGTLQISCSIGLGVPPLDSIRWTHNGTELLPNNDLNRVNIESSTVATTLTLDSVETDEGGLYECIAGNPVGENSASTVVRIQCELYSICVSLSVPLTLLSPPPLPLLPLCYPPVPPGPPTNFVVTGQTTESLDLSWTNPDFDGFSPIASYRVLVINSRTLVSSSVILNVPAGATQGTVALLDPSTEYTLQLSITNEVELEGEFDETTGMTLPIRESLV